MGPNIKEIWRASGEVLAESATLSHEASREGEGRSTYPMRMGKVSANLSLTGTGGRYRDHLNCGQECMYLSQRQNPSEKELEHCTLNRV